MFTFIAKEAPSVSIPESSSLVTLQALDTTLQLYVRSENFLNPVIEGHETYNCPTMAFLVTNQQTGKVILFDAGARRDYWNYSPLVAGRFAKGVNVKGLRVSQGVHEVLAEARVDLNNLESVVWSHWHFDHIGDMSQFPPSVAIVVGPGFKKNLLPGYPSNPDSPLLETDYSGHELREICFDSRLRVGQFQAVDYFGDGSFYLLDVPGHAIGHMCGLARTTRDTFVLLGADCCHFAGSLRPSPYIPLPAEVDSASSGLDACFPNPCPCSLFGDCHPVATEYAKRVMPWYTASKSPGSAYVDPDTANQSLDGIRELDGLTDIFVCLAHDPALFEVLPLLNTDAGNNINDWKVKGYKERVKWMFLNELPRKGKPGRPPIVLGYWRDGKQVDVADAMRVEVEV